MIDTCRIKCWLSWLHVFWLTAREKYRIVMGIISNSNNGSTDPALAGAFLPLSIQLSVRGGEFGSRGFVTGGLS